ncbi:DUF2272 domain-containing protein [Caldichromatium japonicum]|uniref:DUF2272 domain-containing protein n=1 Tax=Caldichromatium japonicum TaxID=2699430 RepID=A0A6G7VCA1_9GAMM|nr:DUF2272 domain-containing protein [Caldichromatium japonicum]QIK37505.1 DUF2272 domain-containing protein [Caldichromatium japonicum]
MRIFSPFAPVKAVAAALLALFMASCAAPPVLPPVSGGSWLGHPIGTPPLPNPRLKQAIIHQAEQEWRFFGRQEVVFAGGIESIPLVGDWEDDGPRQSERVNAYWRAVGHPELTGMDCQKPWSAAFIGWVMQEANVPMDQFRPTIAHWEYLAELIARAPEPGRYFVPRRIQDYSPEPGDLICASRPPFQPLLIDGYIDPMSLGGLKAHCDLVVHKQGRTLEAIGGNVRNSVSRVRLELDPQGHLQPLSRRPWFLIMQNRL